MHEQLRSQHTDSSAETSTDDAGVLRHKGTLQIETITCRGFIITSALDEGTPVGLEVHVRHPKFPGMSRTFLLSEYLRQGLKSSPTTVAQILSSDARESTRLDALRTLTRHIAAPSLREQGVSFRDIGSVEISRDSQADNQQFRIEHRLGTNWNDFVHGYDRQIVSVVREGVPIVDFSVALDQRGEVASALIQLLPLELRWPIVDQTGSAVDRASVWKAVDEYIAFLSRARHYPWPQALEDLGALQDERIARGEEQEDDSVSCVMQVALAVLDEHRYATDPGFSIVDPSRSPFGLEGFARALPDERVLWSSGPDSLEGSRGFEFSLGGFSMCGAPYKVSVAVPHTGAGVLWDAVRQIRFSRTWPELERGLITLARSPGCQFSVTEVTDRALYPRAVNELLERLGERGLAGVVEVGIGRSTRGADAAGVAWVMAGLVRGLAPIHGVVVGPGASSSWRCQGFLDEDLRGQLVFTNQLGGELIVTLGQRAESWRTSIQTIERLIMLMKERPSMLEREIRTVENIGVSAENFPTHVGEKTYATLDPIARLWQRSFKPSRESDELSSFRAHELAHGRWSLARSFSVNGEMSYHTLVVGPLGVERIYLSTGQRSWLGQLRGTEVRPSSGRQIFEDWELRALFPLCVQTGSSVDVKNLHRMISNSVGAVLLRHSVSMREFDPERAQRDLAVIAGRWLRGLLG